MIESTTAHPGVPGYWLRRPLSDAPVAAPVLVLLSRHERVPSRVVRVAEMRDGGWLCAVTHQPIENAHDTVIGWVNSPPTMETT